MDRYHKIKAVMGGSLGNLVEWYDWNIYAVFSIYFAASFFPQGNMTTQLLNTAAIFAVGFLSRPLGAWIMGIYGDRYGRKSGLMLSVSLMCLGSLLIAFSPTYAEAGVMAPVTLVIARVLQGFSVGGEYGASATYVAEMATEHRRAFWCSFQCMTINAGQLLALLSMLVVQMTFDDAAIASFAWRLPFVLGALLALLVYLLRTQLDETEQFVEQSPKRPQASLKHLLRYHRRSVGLIFMITAGGSLTYYTYTIYMQKFLINSSHFNRHEATLIMTAGLVIYTLIQPLYGYLADLIGHKPLLFAFGIGGMSLSAPVFVMLTKVNSIYIAFALIVLLLLILGAYTSIGGLLKASLFPTHIRMLGVSLPFALANTLFGGTAEYMALWLKSINLDYVFYAYVTALIAVATFAFCLLPKKLGLEEHSEP